VRGALLIEAARDLVGMLGPQSKLYLGGGREAAVVRSIQPHGQQYLLLLEGVTGRGAADGYRGQELFLGRSDLPTLAAGTYYHWQIVGLEVVTEEGEALGRVTEILQTGANDVYVVQAPGGAEILLPAIEPVVREIDLEAGRMRVHLLPGLREEQEAEG
jgi:16S rRNA processing protein RimM